MTTDDLTDRERDVGTELVHQVIHELYDLGYVILKLDPAELDRARAQGKETILIEVPL